MNTISNIRVVAFTILLVLGSIPTFGQNYTKAKWSRIPMDSVYHCSQGKATKVIQNHKATSPSLLKPIGKCPEELKFNQLSDLVTDVMLDYAAQRMARETKNPQAKADLAIVNFRNNKVSLPAGDIIPLDIFSLFPIDNQTIILDIKGKYVRELIKNAKNKGAVSPLGKEPIDDNRVYKVVTIDFLFGEGAGTDVLKHAEKFQNCNMPLSNILIQHITKLTKKGETIIKK